MPWRLWIVCDGPPLVGRFVVCVCAGALICLCVRGPPTSLAVEVAWGGLRVRKNVCRVARVAAEHSILPFPPMFPPCPAQRLASAWFVCRV